MPIDTLATDNALAALGAALKSLDQSIKDDVAADAVAINALRAEINIVITQLKTDTNTSISAINTKLNSILTRLTAVEMKLTTPTPTPTPLAIGAVPYFYPSATTERQTMWAQVAADAKIAIINPSSGPGTVADANYAKQLDLLTAKGVLPIGYVATTYGARPIADVIAEAQRLYAQYPGKFKGIFLDEGASSGFDAYYTQIKAAVKALGSTNLVVLNPGTDVPESYMNLCDIVMNAETTAAKYLTRVFPTWTKNYPSGRFWHVVHDCPADQMPAVVDKIKANGAGLCLVTDGAYSLMPTYWTAFVAKVKAA